MNFVDRLFDKWESASRRGTLGKGYQTITENNPVFSRRNGDVYQQELTRAIIERFSTACSKLEPFVSGVPRPDIQRIIDTDPNDLMTWSHFLGICAARYMGDGAVFLVPVFAADQQTRVGIYPIRCSYAELIEYNGEPYMRFTLPDGKRRAVEFSNVAVINRFGIESDVFAERECIDQTLDLMHAQEESLKYAIRNGSRVRFIAGLQGMFRPEDMKKKREAFVESNLTDNKSGIMLYDSSFSGVTQVSNPSYTIDDAEMARIQQNLFSYYGTNSAIVQNSYTEDQWGAWYEGCIEPFAIKMAEGISKLFLTKSQRRKSQVTFSSSRLSYASNPSKRNMCRDMFDRGIFSGDICCDILNIPHYDGGDVHYIRGEYLPVGSEGRMQQIGKGSGGEQPMNVNEGDTDLGASDKEYKDSDGHGVVDVDY